MKTTIGIYDNHEFAVAAVQKLKEHNYPVDNLSIMGKSETEQVDEKIHLIPENPVNIPAVAGGTVIGTALGILTGVGIFAIPGIGFLYGAGALVGAIAGFDFGLIGGGIASVLATVGIKDEIAEKYNEALKNGKFLLVVHGEVADVIKAEQILHEHANYSELASH